MPRLFVVEINGWWFIYRKAGGKSAVQYDSARYATQAQAELRMHDLA